MPDADIFRCETDKPVAQFVRDLGVAAAEKGFLIHNEDKMEMVHTFGRHGVEVAAGGERTALSDSAQWKELRAVREGRVYLTDGNQYFNRPGPRLIESLQILAEILHPEIFPPSQRGRGWEPL